MTRKIKIIDVESGKELRETYTDSDPKFFGMGIRDVVWGIALSAVITTFFMNSDANQKTLLLTVNRLADFRDNSDSFQTQVYGTRFRNGEPIDSNFRLPNRGNINP